MTRMITKLRLIRLFDHSWSAWMIGMILGLSSAGLHGQVDARGLLHVRILGADGEMVPARAWVAVSGGERLFRPSAPNHCAPYARDRSFSCDGWFEMEVPAGAVTIHVEKGKEFTPVDQAAEVRPREKTEVSIALSRWINMPAAGWFSSDFHVHFGHDQLRVLKQLSLADDVHLTPAFTYWLRGTEPEWKTQWPEWPEGETVRVDENHYVTRANLELERISQREVPAGSVGASFLFNLQKPVSAERYDQRFPTDTTLCLNAKRRDPNCVIDTDKPSWGETVIGAALGIYDVAQVCHNHYHRSTTLPGGWGMVGPLAEHEKNLSEPDELFHRTNRQYYHWLNCGIRMGVSGGSAMGVMAVPLGYNRTYAKVDGDFTPDRYWDAVRAGRTFATSGPMLTLQGDGADLGTALARSAGDAVRFKINLNSIEPILAVQWIQNGSVVRDEQPQTLAPGTVLNYNADWMLPWERSGWVAARALFLSPDGRLRQAHTSPIYVIVDEKPVAFRDSAEYMIRWTDRLLEISKLPGRYQSDADRNQVQEIYRRARAYYEEVVRTAVSTWGDLAGGG